MPSRDSEIGQIRRSRAIKGSEGQKQGLIVNMKLNRKPM